MLNDNRMHRVLWCRVMGLIAAALLLALPLALLPASAAAATLTNRADWPQFQRGPERHGENPHEKVLGPSNVSRLTVRWSRFFGKAKVAQTEAQFSPIVADGIVYAYSKGLRNDEFDEVSLWALDAATGAERWSKRRVAGHFAPPLAVARGLLLAEAFGFYSAFDAKTGQLRWQLAALLPGAAPAIVWKSLYVEGSSGSVYCVDLLTGKIRHLSVVSRCVRGGPCGGYWGAPPAITNGAVYISQTGLRANDRATGDLLFDVPLGSLRAYNEVGPLVDGETVYVKVMNEEFTAADMYAVDARSGAIHWQAPIGEPTLSSAAALAKGALFVGSNEGLVALDAATGARLWTQRIIGAVASAPAVANGVVYCLSLYGTLHALDARTGAVLYSRKVAEFLTGASPVVVNGLVYVNTGETLFAFGLPRASGSAGADVAR
jgi:outer membrane protein assembly factor BamB